MERDGGWSGLCWNGGGGFVGFFGGLVSVAFYDSFGCLHELVDVVEVVLILAVAEFADCVDTCDNGVDQFVSVRDRWVCDVLVLELNSVA